MTPTTKNRDSQSTRIHAALAELGEAHFRDVAAKCGIEEQRVAITLANMAAGKWRSITDVVRVDRGVYAIGVRPQSRRVEVLSVDPSETAMVLRTADGRIWIARPLAEGTTPE